MDSNRLVAIQLHFKALKLVVAEDLKGDGGECSKNTKASRRPTRNMLEARARVALLEDIPVADTQAFQPFVQDHVVAAKCRTVWGVFFAQASV